MKHIPAIRIIAVASLFVLAGCAGQPSGPTVVSAEDSGTGLTTIYTVPGYNTHLIDNTEECRLWARNRQSRNTRPCVGEAPTCGEPVNAGQVNVITVTEPDAQEASVSGAIGNGNLVTEGFYRVPVEHTVQDTTFALTRLVAREGCDLLVVGDEEWITLRNTGGAGRNYRYLRVQWGSQAHAGDASQQTAP